MSQMIFGELLLSSIVYIFLLSCYFQSLMKIKDKYILIFFFLLFLTFFNGFFLKSILYFNEFINYGSLENLTPEYVNFNYKTFINSNLIAQIILLFCNLFLFIYAKTIYNSPPNVVNKSTISFWTNPQLFYFIVILFFIIKFIQFKLGLGIMGSENVILPFQLHSFIFRIQGFVFIPLMLNSLIYKFTKTKMFYFALCLLSGIIFGSKSGIYFIILFLASILFINSKLKFKFLIYVFISIPFLLVFYWFGNFFRNVDVISKIDLVEITNSFFNSIEVWIYIFKASLNRFIGIDGIMFFLNYENSITFNNFLNFKFFYTYEVVGVSSSNDFRSPGFFALYLFAFSKKLIIFYPIFLITVFLICIFLLKHTFKFFQGYKLFILYSLYGFFTEGYLQKEDFLSLLIAVLLVYLIDSSLVRKISKL